LNIYSILVYNSFDYTLLYKNFNLSDFYFYTHHKIKSTIIEVANDSVKNLDKKKFYKITETLNDKIFYIYIYTTKDKIYIALTDEEYPSTVILEFVHEIDIAYGDNINNDEVLQNIWTKYQDPIQISKLLQVKEELEKTKKVMLESVDKILERGDKIEDLIIKTDQLECSSHAFKIKAKQLNSCCNIL
jgi:synaptobrevin family protein YKT6